MRLPPAHPVCHAVKPDPPSRPAHVCSSDSLAPHPGGPAAGGGADCGVRIVAWGAPRTHLALAGSGAVLSGAGRSAYSGVLAGVIMCQLSFKPLISHWGWGAKMPAVAEESPSTPPGWLAKGNLASGAVRAHCSVNETRLRSPP